MINSSIQRVLLGKTEKEAASLLQKFNCRWRVFSRDGVQVPNLSSDRDDNRYNLVLKNNVVENIIAG